MEDLGKSLLQFLGSAIIALITSYFAVRAAFQRFKDERRWDRQVAIHTDLIEALSEMYRVRSTQLDRHETMAPQKSEEAKAFEKVLSDRFSAAMRKFESARATAKLLPEGSLEFALKKFEGDMERAYELESSYEYLDTTTVVLKECLQAVVASGRKILTR